MTSLLEAADSVRHTNDVRAEESGGSLTLHHDSWPVAISDDYSDFIQFFGYDPEHWAVENQGTMSKWQQSKGNADGGRDVIWLYSYRGVKFKRKTAGDIQDAADFEEAVKRVRSWKRQPLIRKTLGIGLGPEEGYVHQQGDEQSGKSAGGGIAGLEQREAEALEKSIDHLKRLMKAGHNITSILDASTGDRIENIFGHYPSQARTTATLRNQISYAVDSELRRIEAFSEFGLPMVLPRTPSNHGEIRQAIGMGPYTSESDNLDLMIAEQVKKITDRSKISDQLDWIIPHDEYMTTFEFNGVGCGLTHGHKIRGAGSKAVTDWVKNQRDLYSFRKDFKIRLVFMGHFHHFFVEEVSGTTVIMTGSLDGGSPYFQAGSGAVATPGLLGMTVAAHHSLGFSNLTFL